MKNLCNVSYIKRFFTILLLLVVYNLESQTSIFDDNNNVEISKIRDSLRLEAGKLAGPYPEEFEIEFNVNNQLYKLGVKNNDDNTINHALFFLAQNHLARGDFELSRSNLELILKRNADKKLKINIGTIYMKGMSYVYQQLQNKDSALVYFKQIKPYSDELKFEPLYFLSDFALGYYEHSVLGNCQEAIVYYEKSLNYLNLYSGDHDLAYFYAHAYQSLGDCYFNSGNIDKAIINYEEGLKVSESNGINNYVLRCSQQLLVIYSNRNNIEKQAYYKSTYNNALASNVSSVQKNKEFEERLKIKLEDQNALITLSESKRIEQDKLISITKTFFVVFGILLALILLIAGFLYVLNKRYIIIKRRLDENIHKKEKFYDMISHELKMPLNKIIEISELLDNSEDNNLADPLRYSSNHLLTLINNILHSNNQTQDHLESEDRLKRVDLKRLILTIEETLEIAINNNSNNFHVFIGEKVPEYIIVDEFKLKHILLNLIGNAAKFTVGGDIELEINKLKDISEHDIELEFAIKDTGVGISKDKLDKIFILNQSGLPSIDPDYQGTGLGLMVVKRLLDGLDGQIFAYSEVNKGSDFRFQIIVKDAIAVDEIIN